MSEMSRFSLVLVCLLLVTAGCNRFGEPPRYAFQRFKGAVEESDYVAIEKEVSTESLKYLKSLETWALRGKPDQVEELPLFDRFLILRLRMLHEDWEFERWQEYSAVFSESGLGPIWLPLIEYHFLDYNLGKVKYYEGIAGGPLLLGSKEVDTRIRFLNEDRWKIDLVGLFRDEFEAMIAPYMGANYNNLNRVDVFLKTEFGSTFSKDLYRSRLDPPSLDQVK